MDDSPDDWDYESQPAVQSWRELIGRLTDEGFRITGGTAIAPLQLEGYLPTRERFYFRSRFSLHLLRVAHAHVDPVSDPLWSGFLVQEEGAVYDHAEESLRHLLGSYADSHPPH